MGPRAEFDRGSYVTAGAVARKAGVSRSTVSRAFTPGSSISREARARVMVAAALMGYRVNRLAQSLTRARSPLVGLVGANLETPFQANLMADLSEALLRQGMQCVLLNARGTVRDVAPLIANLLEFRARAVVILSGTPPVEIIEECRRSRLKVILINRPLPEAAVHTILCDDRAGAELAAGRLLAAGCRNLAVIGSASGTPSITRRIEAFSAHLKARGIEPVVWLKGPTGYETGRDAARTLLGGQRLDGAFCATDLIAMGFVDGARHDRGLRVPEDVSVIGFDDIPQAAWQAYQLTTIRQSVPNLVEAVMRAIASEEEALPGAAPVLLPVSLIERTSARPIR